jgi:predicted Kef-type K+ transport protein
MPHDTTLIATIAAGLVFAFIGGFAAWARPQKTRS